MSDNPTLLGSGSVSYKCGKDRSLQPRFCFLNVWEATHLTRMEQTWVTLGMAIAKQNIAHRWGALEAPTAEEWKPDMDLCMLAEKAVFVNRGCPRKWDRILGKWNAHRGIVCASPSIQADGLRQQGV